MTTLTEARPVRKRNRTKTIHVCVDCDSIIQPWQRDEPVREGGKFTGRRRHQTCPPIHVAAARLRIPPAPIPAPPTPAAHFARATRSPRVWVAAGMIAFGAAAAVFFMVSIWGAR